MSPLDPLSLVAVVIHSSAAEIPSEGLFGSHDVVAGGVHYVEGFCWERDVDRLSEGRTMQEVERIIERMGVVVRECE